MEEDHAGGRTDDDLFADEFEPIEHEQPAVIAPAAEVASVQTPVPFPTTATASDTKKPSPPTRPSSKRPASSRKASALNAAKPSASKQNAAKNTARPSSSKHSDASPKPSNAASKPAEDAATSSPAGDNVPPNVPSTAAATTTTDSAAIPADKPPLAASATSAARVGSGANPRTKPTPSELAAKMEHMLLVNAEKTRKFEQASLDEQAHAKAYEQEMDDARLRRAAEAERRRRAEDDRRELEAEREKNRARKLKALGGWDEAKVSPDEEGGPRRDFRSGSGGVRGGKTTLGNRGLASSRFAKSDDAVAGAAAQESTGKENGGRHSPPPAPKGLAGSRFAKADYSPEEGRRQGDSSRGRGRGDRGGRGGRYSHHNNPDASPPRHHQQQHHNNRAGHQQQKPPQQPSVESAEDFPALPGTKPVIDTSTRPAIATAAQVLAAAPPPVPALLASPVGKWDEEVEAMDEKLRQQEEQKKTVA